MKNDHDLFIEFYEQYKNKLFTYLMYRLNFDKELSEDLLMDIVLKAYEKFGSYKEKKGSFKSWIFTIAHNHLLNYWRDQKKKKTVDIESVSMDKEVLIDDKGKENVDKEIEMKRIREVFVAMNESGAELLELKYIHDFSNKEIAKVLKKREGAVRTALTRAISQFKELYNKMYN